MLNPRRFLSTPLIAPRTECACQPVACIICSMVTPLAERSSVMSFACLLSVAGFGLVAVALGVAFCVSRLTRAARLAGAFFEVFLPGMDRLLVRRRGIAAYDQ